MLNNIHSYNNAGGVKHNAPMPNQVKNVVNKAPLEPKKPELPDMSKNDKFNSRFRDELNIYKNEPSKKDSAVLSEAAQALLEELKKNYGNVDFIVANFSSDKEAQRYLATGKGEFNCVITPSLLEKMAADANVRAQYESMIGEAVNGLAEVKEKAQPVVKEIIKNLGVTLDSDGNITYYAILNKGLPKSIYADLGDSATVKASTIEQLLQLLDEIAEKRKSDDELKAIISSGDTDDIPVDNDETNMDFKA
ncbi:MAG: DUF6033 family protein [Oscillospiraceae bacterium]|nr:DUF6033 family protein [Oscillospiraceae bacterium]